MSPRCWAVQSDLQFESSAAGCLFSWACRPNLFNKRSVQWNKTSQSPSMAKWASTIVKYQKSLIHTHAQLSFPVLLPGAWIMLFHVKSGSKLWGLLRRQAFVVDSHRNKKRWQKHTNTQNTSNNALNPNCLPISKTPAFGSSSMGDAACKVQRQELQIFDESHFLFVMSLWSLHI